VEEVKRTAVVEAVLADTALLYPVNHQAEELLPNQL
jgi:hypothetical protein